MRPRSSARPAATLWPPKRVQHRRARLERRQHVERGNAAARPVRDVAIDRQHDRGPVERVDELAGDDADDAAMPAFAGHDEHGAGADVGIALDDLLRLGDDRRLFLLAADVLLVQLLGQRPAPLRPAPRRRPAAGASRCRACHAAGGVDPRRQDEADVVAADALAGKPGAVEQGLQADLVRPFGSAGRGRAWR